MGLAFKLLLPPFPCLDGLYPELRSKKNDFSLNAFAWVFNDSSKKRHKDTGCLGSQSTYGLQARKSEISREAKHLDFGRDTGFLRQGLFPSLAQMHSIFRIAFNV